MEKSLSAILGKRASVKRVVEFVQNKLAITPLSSPNMFKAGEEVVDKNKPSYSDALDYAVSVYSSLAQHVNPPKSMQALTVFSGDSLDFLAKAEPKKDILARFLDEYVSKYPN